VVGDYGSYLIKTVEIPAEFFSRRLAGCLVLRGYGRGSTI
jgi:hypothetical protein